MSSLFEKPHLPDIKLARIWIAEYGYEVERPLQTLTVPLDWPEVQQTLSDKLEGLEREIAVLQSERISYLREERVSPQDPEDWHGLGFELALKQLQAEQRRIKRFILGQSISQRTLEAAKGAPIEQFFPGLSWRSGRATVLCPFHNERTASCVIYRSQNRFRCFGCGKFGDVIDLLTHFEGLSFGEAVRRLTGT